MKKKITLIVSNSELNALEDLLYCEIDKKDLRLSKKLWKKLVKAWGTK